MTFCPRPGFKKKGFFYSEKSFFENSFTLEDTFVDETVASLKNETLYFSKNTSSQAWGNCFTLCCLIPVSLRSTSFVLGLKTSFDVIVFVHPQGAELWMTGFGEFPFDIASLTIASNDSNGIVGAMLFFREVETTFLNKKEFPCKVSSENADMVLADYIQCSKEQLWSNLPSSINCTIVDMKNIVPKNSKLNECKDNSTAESVYWQFADYVTNFVKQAPEYGCPVPCTQISYKLSLDYMHGNTLMLPNQDSAKNHHYFTIIPHYSTFNAEERIENLEYDIATLLVSAGGNLGLFLGLSCLPVLFAMIKCIRGLYNNIFRDKLNFVKK
jgi:hypothetical protein